MKKITTTALATFFSIGLLFSQSHDESKERNPNWCGKNHVTEKHYEAHPEHRAIDQAELEAFNNSVRNYDTFQKGGESAYIIPVVFHIVHAGGNENISEAQINSAIEVLNEDYSASNPDLGVTIPEFESIIADVGIEFRLAKIDPDGNCTNGINRVYNEATYGGDEMDVKDGDASIWDRNSYLNIWVVRDTDNGSEAYAYFPSPWTADRDGIMCKYNRVGRIEESSPYDSHTLSHEFGHYLRLEHVWGDTEAPGLASNCNIDDGVSDTPLTEGRQWSGQDCDLYDETCGSLDNVQNQMDYSWCSTMFTEGQKTRMLTALNGTTGGRKFLHTDDNLADTGVLNPDVICSVDFTTEDEPIICPGQELIFMDLSFNGVTTREWTFEGGNPATSGDLSPTVVWDTPGVYDVTLTASNAGGGLTEIKEGFVTVLPEGENSLPFSESFESFTDLENNDQNWFVLDLVDQDEKWELRDDVGYTGSQSVWVNGRDNANNAVEILSSPTYDLTGLSENAVLSFKYAHAKRLGSSDDRLRVMISKNCGDFWTVRKTLNIDDLPTVPNNVTGEFVPNGADEWAEVVISTISGSYLTDQFRIRFEYTSYRGNNIFIDDINIFDPTTVGLEGVTFVNKLDLYPNPSSQNTRLSYSLEQSSDVRVDVLDISGRIVSQVYQGTQASGDQNIEIELTGLESGVYLVRIQSGGEQIVRKLVKQ